MNAQDRRKVIDKVAAAVMLQSWLDGRHQFDGEAPDRSARGSTAGERHAD